MTTSKDAIKRALQRFSNGNLADNARHLLNVLGYRSERRMDLEPNTADGFLSAFNPDDEVEFKPERALTEEWESVDLLFQLMDENVGGNEQVEIQFRGGGIDDTRMESYLFFALKLRKNRYTRNQLSQITREINKLTPMPAMILFQHGDTLTLAVIDRRLHKLKKDKDALEKTTLIKDINFADPHRAHIDILLELALEPLHQTYGVRNFVELHRAWAKTLNTEELNKKFYRELFDWFEWTVLEAKFPADKTKTLSPQEHIIRLITRMLFVWFLKEKGLIAKDLFNEETVRDLLKDYDRDTDDSYYRAVLQNLFFATLNTEIGKREFSKGGNPDHRNFSRYRYKDQISDPDELLALFAQTPFVNGGLFDCLDSFKGKKEGGYRIDCFSDVHYHMLSIPNRLFFDNDRGLIPILKHYKFTVEESTPIEQEVALDPELLGRVFENLLATYNPETGQTKQKQTGSYYTPRPIVDYMVEETLVATLAGQVSPTDGDEKLWEERLRCLIDYAEAFDDVSEWFDDDETDGFVQAISELKILDPAVGSGAFPMGVLHKLTLALRRLDPDNNRWEKLQRDRAAQKAADAFDTIDDQTRPEELLEIDETFKRYRDSDFGRKLYLIQNSIFGVDIQPVACQIAKLRFFISLAIEQVPDKTADNFGIKPLPNLETRFVAANTLIGLQPTGGASLLKDDAVQRWLREIERIREKYFLANNRSEKLNLEKREDACREQLEKELEIQKAKWEAIQQREIKRKVTQIPNPEHRQQLLEEEQKKYKWRKERFDADFEEARRIARWKPYDQNATADFFDPERMFGVRDGFDITIGNPPYVRADARGLLAARRKIENTKQYETLWEKWDLYIPFIERSYKLLKPSGFTTMIVSDAYCHSKYAQKSQDWFLKNSRILRLDFFSKIKIFDAGVRNITYLFQHSDGSQQKPERRVHDSEFGVVKLLPTNEQRELTYRVFFPEDTDFQSSSVPAVSLEEICYITKRMIVHAHEKKARGEFELRDLVSNMRDEHHPKPFVEGKHLARWIPATNKWLEWGTKRAPSLFSRPTFPELYEVGEKLISVDMAAGVEKLRVAYDNQKFYHNHSAWSFIPWHSLSGIRNRSIKKQTRYRDEIPRPDLPDREELEMTSRRFAVKFLLGVMNSTVAHNFLKANRRSNIHLYPDDWKRLPIPDVAAEQQAPIIELVDQILVAKRADPDADVSQLENEIDQVVYSLYNLTPDEVAIVE